MKNKRYKIDRNKIWIGQVIMPNGIYVKDGSLNVESYSSLRSMLFTLNEENLANDLLYNSPNYPILNISNDSCCFNSVIAVKDAYNLALLLEYFGYDNKLTYGDILRIKRKFFTGTFAKDNCELFGFKEILPEDWVFYMYEDDVIDSRIIKGLAREYKQDDDETSREFVGIKDIILPREYFDVLDEWGNKSKHDAKLLNEPRNAFKPHREEVLVRKLKRF